MKRIILFLIVLTFSASLYAKGPNGLYLTFGYGYTNQGRGLRTITEDEGIHSFMDPASTFIPDDFAFLPSSVISTFSNSYNPTIYDTGSDPIANNESYTSTDAFNFSGGLKYIAFDFLFIRSEFQYEFNFIESRQEVEFNNYSLYEASTSQGPNSTTLEQFANYEYMAAPVIIGLNIPLYNKKSKFIGNAYIGAGASFIMTKYTMHVSMPEYYIINDPQKYDIDMTFESWTIAPNIIIGMEYEVYSNTYFFLEIDSVFAQKNYIECEIGAPFNRKVSAPMDFSGTIIKMGISYNTSSFVNKFLY